MSQDDLRKAMAQNTTPGSDRQSGSISISQSPDKSTRLIGLGPLPFAGFGAESGQSVTEREAGTPLVKSDRRAA